MLNVQTKNKQKKFLTKKTECMQFIHLLNFRIAVKQKNISFKHNSRVKYPGLT
jgi:hypothetical protein